MTVKHCSVGTAGSCIQFAARCPATWTTDRQRRSSVNSTHDAAVHARIAVTGANTAEKLEGNSREVESAQWGGPNGIEAWSLGLLFHQCFDTLVF